MAITLEELGQVLRAEREKKALSVDDVAHGLKISARVLRALEAGDAASLPHAVYVRGFVSAYGKFLELDVQELLEAETLFEEQEENLQSPAFEAPPVQPKAKKSSAAPLAFFLCFLIAGGSGVWFFRDAALFSDLQENHLTAAQPAPALPQEKKEQPVAKAQPAVQKAVAPAATTAVADVKQEKPKAQAVAKTAPIAVAKVEKKPEPRVTEATQERVASTSSSLAQGPHKVIITALATTWIHSAADNAGKRQFSLKPGDTFALTFEDSLHLTLGNAGGVRVHYNGKEMSALGREGEEKTVQFPPKM